ncbi:MAG: helix-turn-helix domain-containing protein, partial [Flavobacteriaceae bacterium]|nr:helix-turn-helix domain-containing protein [Flavobacteriaceae bacterium]
KFEEKIPGLESYRWISVEETSKELEISKRTVFQYLKDGRIKGTKYKNQRLIDSVSILGFLLEKKVIEFNKINSPEMRRQIELDQFNNI